MPIVAFCNPLLDISVQVNEDSGLLQKYELKANNVILAEDKHDGLIEEMSTIHSDSLEYCAGGAGLNSLRVAQLLLDKDKTAVVGSIGNDRFGDILIEKSHQDGVRPFLTRHSPKPTGRCACLINGHNRSLVAFLDAANDFLPEKLEPAMTAIKDASLLYITGFFMAVSWQSVERILELKSEKAKVVFNLSAPFVCQMFNSRLASILAEKIDFLVGNGDELFAWAASINLPAKISFEDAFEALSQQFPATTLIITHGSAPIQVKRPNKPTFSVPVPAIPAEEIVDTTGAGDAFVGGLLVALEEQLELEIGIELGCFLAGQVIRQPGIKFPEKKLLMEHFATLKRK